MGVGPHSVTGGSTDVSCTIYIANATTGAPETAVEHNTSGIDLWYQRTGAAKVSITEAALSALTDAHSDGGIEAISNGTYRLDLPDAAVAAGVLGVQVGGTVTGMVVYGPYIQIDPPVNVTKIGGDAQSMTDLKDFADAGYDPSTNKVQGVVLVDTVTTLGSTGLAAIVTAFGGIAGAVEDNAGNSSTQLQTNLAETADDYYIGSVLVFTSGTNINQARRVTDYVGSTGTVTVSPAFDAEPDAADAFIILGRIN